MKLFIQKLTVGIVLRVVHAALVELYHMDSRVKAEFDALPEEMSYSIATGYDAPVLNVLWEQGSLKRVKSLKKAVCNLAIKSTAHSFQMFTGQMGLAQAYARHAFTMQGEIADVMKLARLVNIVEAYLFPNIINRRIMTDIPKPEVCFLRTYARVACGFLCFKYRFSQ